MSRTGKQVKKGVCIVTYPRVTASIQPLSNIVKIMSEISDYVYLITGNEGERILSSFPSVQGYSIKYPTRKFFLWRIFGFIWLQIIVSLKMLRANSKVKVYLFFMGEGMLVPSLVAKMTGKPLVIALAGSLKKIHESDRSFLSRLYIFLEDINYKLANKLVVYSPKLVREWDLEKYRNKILIGHEHYLDFDEFRITEKFVSRGQVAGYVGRLSEEKGINNLVQSISLVIREANDIHFAIGGDGPLKAKLSEYVTRHSLDQTVQFYGWIDHKELPKFLNTVKLVIIPSYTEGLPNAMLEAMACGALVLSTPVGAIPDFIRDGETGFLMEDNSPECIARNVVRVMKRKDLELISRNAQALVAQQFNFSSAVEQYQKVITSAITIHST